MCLHNNANISFWLIVYSKSFCLLSFFAECDGKFELAIYGQALLDPHHRFYAVGIYRLTLWHWLTVIAIYAVVDNVLVLMERIQPDYAFTGHLRFCRHCRDWSSLY